MTIRISRACVLIWLALLLSATGCGEDVETGVVDRQDLEPEALIEPEAMPPEPSPTPDPIVLEVTFVEVSVDPLRHVYAPGLQLLPEVTIYDQFGREMEASATLNVEPDGAA